MHYDFKQKLDKIDSNAYVNLQIPEIDRKLNEGMLLFILLIAEPRYKNQFGFETSQRTIDDLRILVRDDIDLALREDIDGNFVATLPDNYMYYLSTGKLLIGKDNCESRRFTTNIIRHNDQNERRDFYKSDFDWRECNIRFFSTGIKIFTPEEATVESFSIDYILQPDYIHNAEDFASGSYKLPGSTTPFTGFRDSILPEHTHKEIVDLAVMLTTGDLEMPLAAQFKQGVLRTKQLL